MKKALASLLVLLALWAVSSSGWAQACRKTGEVCVDGPATRDVNGVEVTRDCWQYTDTYECLAPSNVDYCSAVREMPGCVQSGSVCSQRGFNDECLEYVNTYRCGDAITPPVGVIQLDNEYTITADVENRSACSSVEANPRCGLAERTCVEPGGTRIIDGLEVTRDCWSWQERYTCVAMESDCAELSSDETCSLTSTTCEDRNPDGTCSLTANNYTCTTGPGEPAEVTTCNGGTFCVNGLCFDRPQGNDRDFAVAVTMMEAGRQAAGYAVDPNALRFFTGEADTCTVTSFANCCRTNARGADKSNGAMIGTVMQAGRQAFGSWYVYDALSGTTRSTNALGALYSSFAAEGFSGFDATNFIEGFSYYGVSINTAATSVTNMFAFDPTSFAIAVAIQILAELTSCEQEEEVLAMKRGQNLCSYVGSYCNRRAFGSCVSRRSSYCCFNSKLARIIQEQGRTQLGLDWGTAEVPNCEGLTQDQFQQIDFSAVDFSEFVQDIMDNVRMPDVTGIQSDNQQQIERRINNYFNQ